MGGAVSATFKWWAVESFHAERREGCIHSQLDFSSSNFPGSMKGLSMDLIISSPQYTHSDAMISSMSDFICSRLVPALPFPRLEVSPSSLGCGRWRDFDDCVVAASFFCSSSRRLCLKTVRWVVTSWTVERKKKNASINNNGDFLIR